MRVRPRVALPRSPDRAYGARGGILAAYMGVVRVFWQQKKSDGVNMLSAAAAAAAAAATAAAAAASPPMDVLDACNIFYDFPFRACSCVARQAVGAASTFRMRRVDVVKEVSNLAYLRALLGRLHK